MISTAFYLKKPNAEKATTLFVLISTPQGRTKAYLPMSPHPDQWDATKQQFKKTFPSFKEANLSLNQLSASLQSYYLNRTSAGTPPSPTELKEQVDSFYGKVKPDPKAPTLNETYQEFLESYIVSRATSTVAKHRRNLELLQFFVTTPNMAPLKREKPKNGQVSTPPPIKFKDIPFEKVTVVFVEKWVDYLIKHAGFTNNTAAKAIRLLKTFLNWATARGYNSLSKYKEYKDPGLSKETEVIALTEDELMRLYFLDLSGKPSLARVRDVFCFGAFTGQRFSDVAGLRPEHIKGNSWHLRVQKTREINKVPLHPFALAILKRYKNGQLPAISNQKSNEYLKKLGELAEINEPITLHRFSGAKKIERTEPKYKFIGTHTARRTFATVMLEKKIQPQKVMRIGGWKDHRTFNKYIRLTDKETEAEMIGLSFDTSKYEQPLS